MTYLNKKKRYTFAEVIIFEYWLMKMNRYKWKLKEQFLGGSQKQHCIKKRLCCKQKTFKNKFLVVKIMKMKS